jgi:hypothetical protein
MPALPNSSPDRARFFSLDARPDDEEIAALAK